MERGLAGAGGGAPAQSDKCRQDVRIQTSASECCSELWMKNLNIGLIGYGFMGRTHSNAFLQAPRFFDLGRRPVLKAVAARNADRVKKFAENWGYESYVTDWR